MWEAVVVGLIGLGGVALGQGMSRGVAQDSLSLQLEEQRRLEVRRLLVRLIVDVRAQVDGAWVLLPLMADFESSDWHEWVDTDTGRAIRERNGRVQEDIVALGLLVPDGALRDALRHLEVEAVRDWSDKAVGPVTSKSAPEDGRDRTEVAFAHVQLCQRALNAVQREAALYLAAPPDAAQCVSALAGSTQEQGSITDMSEESFHRLGRRPVEERTLRVLLVLLIPGVHRRIPGDVRQGSLARVGGDGSDCPASYARDSARLTAH